MNRELEKQKEMTNKIFGYYSSYKEGQCTYDRALELGSKVLNEYAQSQTSELQTEINRLKAENEWISVKDELPNIGNDENFPECSDKVLLLNEQEDVFMGWYEGGEFTDYNMNKADYITHWMPLPQPPKDL